MDKTQMSALGIATAIRLMRASLDKIHWKLDSRELPDTLKDALTCIEEINFKDALKHFEKIHDLTFDMDERAENDESMVEYTSFFILSTIMVKSW